MQLLEMFSLRAHVLVRKVLACYCYVIMQQSIDQVCFALQSVNLQYVCRMN